MTLTTACGVDWALQAFDAAGSSRAIDLPSDICTTPGPVTVLTKSPATP